MKKKRQNYLKNINYWNKKITYYFHESKKSVIPKETNSFNLSLKTKKIINKILINPSKREITKISILDSFSLRKKYDLLLKGELTLPDKYEKLLNNFSQAQMLIFNGNDDAKSFNKKDINLFNSILPGSFLVTENKIYLGNHSSNIY